MSEQQPILSSETLSMTGSRRDPWRQLLVFVNYLTATGVFSPAAHTEVRNCVEMAVFAQRRLGILTVYPHSSARPIGPFGRTGSDELYFRSLELHFLQYEVFRLVRRVLRQPHTHMSNSRFCAGVCTSLATLHYTLTKFRRMNQPTEFVEHTLNDPAEGPLHLLPRFQDLRQMMIQEQYWDTASDEIARYVSRISAITIDDQEWDECATQINHWRLHNPYDGPPSNARDDSPSGISQDIVYAPLESENGEEYAPTDFGLDGAGDFEAEPARSRLHTRPPPTRPISFSDPPPSALRRETPFSQTINEDYPFDPAPNSSRPVVNIRRHINNADHLNGAGPHGSSVVIIDSSATRFARRATFPGPHPPPYAISPLSLSPSLSPLSRPATSTISPRSGHRRRRSRSRSRSPLDPTAPPYDPDNPFAGMLTAAETEYLNRADSSRRSFWSNSPGVVRQGLAATVQEALDRVGPVAGVARGEDWEERDAAMRAFAGGFHVDS